MVPVRPSSKPGTQRKRCAWRWAADRSATRCCGSTRHACCRSTRHAVLWCRGRCGVRKRWWLLVPAVLLAGLAGTFLYLRSAYPPERLLALLEPRVEAALGRDVEIGGAQLVPFPLAVRLDAVRIAAAPGSTAASLLEIGSIRFELRLMPLLRREVRVRTLVLDSPRVILEQNAAKRWNFARSGPAAAPK